MKTVLLVDHRNYGMASRSLKEAKSLSTKYNVIWIGVGDKSDVEYQVPMNNLQLIKLRNYFYDKSKFKVFGILRLNVKLISVLVSLRYDVIIVHDLKVMFSVLISLLRKTKIIYDAHEIHFTKRNEVNFRNILLNRVDFWSEHLFIKYFAATIQTNIKRAELFAAKHKVNLPVVIENYDSENFGTDTIDIRDNLGVDPSRKIIIMSGYISTGWIWKPEIVIEALPLLPPEIIFCMMGFVQDDTKTYLLSFANSLGVAERVFFHSAVPPEMVVKSLRSADIAVIPLNFVDKNSEFPSPNKLYQAVSAHVPVVYSNNEFLRKVINENEVGRIGVSFKIDDHTTFVTAINEVFSHYSELKVNVSQVASQLYNWDVEVRKLFKIIDEF